MTEPWEEAMERLAQMAEFQMVYAEEVPELLATIRKHIEDLTLQMKIARTDQKQCHAAHEDQAKQLEIAKKMETYWRDKFQSRPDQARGSELAKQLADLGNINISLEAQLRDLMDANIYQQADALLLQRRIEELAADALSAEGQDHETIVRLRHALEEIASWEDDASPRGEREFARLILHTSEPETG